MDHETRVPPDAQETFLTEIAQNRLAPLWEIYQTLVIEEPKRVPPTVICRWSEMAPVIEKSAHLVTGESAGHRVLVLDNPHLKGPPATSSTIVAAFQCVLPGKKSSPHRHTPAATRVILEGAGGATFVDGKRCDLYNGDLIIPRTRRGIAPRVTAERARSGSISWTLPWLLSWMPYSVTWCGSTRSRKIFLHCQIMPLQVAVRHSPRLGYPWYEALATMDAGPTTGKHRTTSNAVAVVLDGEGVSEIGDQEIAGGPKDVSKLPHRAWTSH